MIVTRWLAPLVPSKIQTMILLKNEGLEPFEEQYDSQIRVKEHKHPFTEVRVVVSGELLFSIQGNQFLLRAGDRVEIPSNTRHWHQAQGTEKCLCVCAQRVS